MKERTAVHFCARGDHFSGRGGVSTGLTILLNPEAYQRYLEAYQDEIEDFKGGAR